MMHSHLTSASVYPSDSLHQEPSSITEHTPYSTHFTVTNVGSASICMGTRLCSDQRIVWSTTSPRREWSRLRFNSVRAVALTGLRTSRRLKTVTCHKVWPNVTVSGILPVHEMQYVLKHSHVAKSSEPADTHPRMSMCVVVYMCFSHPSHASPTM